MSIERYLEATNTTLPLLAKQNNWPVTENHCIQRLVLDYVCLDDWRKHIRSPAYKNLTSSQLERALFIIDKLLTGNKSYVDLLQYASLKWRGKV